MASEADAIPYEPARLRGERLLVLAPHPDDEVIGCGGVAAQHLREGRSVRVVIATDGAQAGDAAAREEESRCSFAIMEGRTPSSAHAAEAALSRSRADEGVRPSEKSNSASP